jgi:hypothetical protein
MLIFSQGDVSITGSGGSWTGIIYAYVSTATKTISLAGNGTNSLTGALYSDNVNISGGGWTLTGTGPVPIGIFISGLTE